MLQVHIKSYFETADIEVNQGINKLQPQESCCKNGQNTGPQRLNWPEKIGPGRRSTLLGLCMFPEKIWHFHHLVKSYADFVGTDWQNPYIILVW